MKRSILSVNIKLFLFLLLSILGLNACDEIGVGEPMATKLKTESSAYNVHIQKTAIADTVVATIRWIDIQSPSYTLVLSNSSNDSQIELTSNQIEAASNVKFITFTDKQILEYLTQMQLGEDETAALKLTISGIRTDGKPDQVSVTINVSN